MPIPERFKFSKAQLADIRRSRELLAAVIPAIDSAEKCGVDCTERKMMREELDKLLAQMEIEYGNG